MTPSRLTLLNLLAFLSDPSTTTEQANEASTRARALFDAAEKEQEQERRRAIAAGRRWRNA